MKGLPKGKALFYSLISFLVVLMVACGTSATPTSAPPTPTTTTAAPEATEAPQSTTAMEEATATPVPTTAPQPTAPSAEVPQSAKDKAIAVIGQEPGHLFVLQPTDAHTGQLLDTVYAYVGHMDKTTLQLAPTAQVVSWEQTAPDEWIFSLRPGVTFHNGDEWNAEAFQVYSQFAGDPASGVGTFAHTGPYTVEVVDDLTARVKCGGPCPIFARAMNVAQAHAPSELREKGLTDIRIGIGVGPYKIDDWLIGQKVITSKFEGFVPVPENPEYAAPALNEIEWQWRSETTVRTAMIETGEADWAFLLNLEDAERLGSERFVTGGTAEIAQFLIDTVFDPWLSQVEMRRALVHSINCQDIVDSLYQGATTCRGNTGAPGVLGITPENIAPYKYDPALSQQLLEEIGYICDRPNSAPNCEAEIEINSRSARIPRNTELVESMVSFMREVGINAKANFLETAFWTEQGVCGVGHPQAQVVGWQGATETKAPADCVVPQIRDSIGFGYETLDYAKFINRHMNCESTRGFVCVPEKNEEWQQATTLSGEERRQALEKVATEARDQVYLIPMFDLFAVYGINPKLRGFEEPRFDKHLYANLWWFEE